MAMATGKVQCFICDKEKSTYSCRGCSRDFCFDHLQEHRQTFGKQFDEIENDRDQLQQTLSEQKQEDPKTRLLIQQINRWEYYSIQKIKDTAEECRQTVIEHTNQYWTEIEMKLIQLTEELRQVRRENEFNEIDLDKFKIKLTKLTEELHKPLNISTEHECTSFINKISVISSSGQLNYPTRISLNRKWRQNGITIAGGNGEGNELNQLSDPEGIYIDDDQTIYIADTENHRIVEWKCGAKNGQIVAGGNGKGNRTDQLDSPTDVIVDKENDSLIICDQENRQVVIWSRQNSTSGETIISDIDCWGLTIDNNGYIYVSDTDKNEVRRWRIGESSGTIVAGGNGEGDHLNQLNCPTFIFVDKDYSVYVSDEANNRVMKWVKGAKEGVIVAGGKDEGDSLTQLSSPQGVIVDQLGQIYVADFGNDRVMRWCNGAIQGSLVVGGNEEGDESNHLNVPCGLSFDRQGNLYVVDCEQHRIQKFEIDLN